MFIIVLSKNPALTAGIISGIDEIIVKNHFSSLSLYSFTPFTLEKLHLLKNDPSYFYVLADNESYPDILPVLKGIDSTLSHYVTGILSCTDQYSTDLLNSPYPIRGFLNMHKKDCTQRLTELLRLMNQNYRNFSGGLCVKHMEATYVLSFQNIYYIETEKGTHRCLIHHTSGTFSIRANIKDLIEELDSRFLVVRSSTIANLGAIQKIDTNNRLLYFTDTLSCTYSQNCYRLIKSLIQGKLY